MEFLLKFFQNQISLNSILQIGMDIIILCMLAIILTMKKPRISRKDEAVMQSLERIIEETADISRRFDANLKKRQDLLQQITAKLDTRIQEAQNLCVRMEKLSQMDADRPAVQPLPPPAPRSPATDQQKVLLLAAKGMDASEIAKSLKRPVGEVELILNLQKIAS